VFCLSVATKVLLVRCESFAVNVTTVLEQLPTLFARSSGGGLWQDRIRSDRIGSDRIGSDRIGSDRIGSDRIGSDRIGSDRIAGGFARWPQLDFAVSLLRTYVQYTKGLINTLFFYQPLGVAKKQKNSLDCATESTRLQTPVF
jgi:hypothetical protein